MDVRMPIVDGVAATADLRRREGAPPVLVLTTFDDDDDDDDDEVLAAALRAGPSGFLLKGVPVDDLQRAVRAVAEGGAWLDPAVTGRVLSTYRSTPMAVGPDTAADVLTARERQVLALIGQGLTNNEPAGRRIRSPTSQMSPAESTGRRSQKAR
jgi:DNA-binding NarL/FixJ family response regulator